MQMLCDSAAAAAAAAAVLLLLYCCQVTDTIEAWLEQLTGGMPCDSQ
jgi:hypothetical protein